MTKTIMILILISTNFEAFSCDTNNIVYSSESNFFFNSSGKQKGNSNYSINIPVFIDGEAGCWKQKTELSFSVDDEKKKLTIYTPEVDHENIDNFSSDTYLQVEKKENNLYIEIANFICAGNSVLASSSFSGSIDDARAIDQLTINSASFMATGAAAKVMEERKRNIMKKYGRGEELPAHLLKYFSENYSGDWNKLSENHSASTPSVFVESRTQTPLTEINSRYSTIVATQAACSEDFRKTMMPFKLENIKLSDDLIYKIKKNKIKIRW